LKQQSEFPLIESERKRATVLFSDLSGYTQLSERLDPEEVKEITNHIFNNVSKIIKKYNGFVERVIGDEILAFFGVPKSYEDHPLSAILAAREIHDTVKHMSLEIEDKTGQTLRMHSGINTGLVITGDTDVSKGLDGFSGQTINIASRLADMAAPDEILIGPDTYKKTSMHIVYEPITPEISGLNNYETPIYRLIDIQSKGSRFYFDPEYKLTPFVGRVRELNKLRHCLRKSQSGRPLAVSIVSRPGEGKSRLLYEFKNTIAESDVAFLEAKCFSFYSKIPYFPVINLLKEYFRVRDADNDSVTKQKVIKGLELLGLTDPSTVSCILQLLSIKSGMIKPPALDIEDLKERLSQVVRQMFLRGSKNRVIIVAIEDLHWMDKSSEEYLDQMLKHLPESRLLIILTYRPVYTPPWKRELKSIEITLDRLNDRDCLAMVRNLLGTERLDGRLSDLFLEKARGVPLYVEEFTTSLLNRKKINRRKKTSYLKGNLKNLTIPATIQDLISTRIDSLPKAVKELLQSSSVAGKSFSFEIIKWVTGLPEEDLLLYLSFLIKNNFLFPGQSGLKQEYHFRHSLIHEVAYNNLLLSKRKQIHFKLAEAIESCYFNKLEHFYEILAHHYSKGAGYEKAYDYLMLSGKKAMLNYSNQEALYFFKSAANQAPNETAKEKRIEALKLALIPMVRLGYPDGSLDLLNLAVELTEAINDLKSLAKFYDVMGNYYTAKGGNPVLGIKYSEKCLTEVEKIKDPELIARVVRGLCGSYIVVGEPLKSFELADRTIKQLEQPIMKDKVLGAEISSLPVLKALLAHSLGWLGNFSEARKWGEIAAASANRLDNFYDQAYVHFLCGYLYMHLGDGGKVIEHFNHCIHCCEEGEVILWIGLGWTGLGVGYFLSNDLKSAENFILKGLKLQSKSSIPYYLSFHNLALGLVYYEANQISRSKKFFQSALKLSKRYSEKWIEGLSTAFLAIVLNRMNRHLHSFPGMDVNIREGIKILENRKILPWSTVGYYILGKLYSYNDHPKGAMEYLKKAENLFNEMGMEYWLNHTQKALKDLTFNS